MAATRFVFLAAEQLFFFFVQGSTIICHRLLAPMSQGLVGINNGNLYLAYSHGDVKMDVINVV